MRFITTNEEVFALFIELSDDLPMSSKTYLKLLEKM